MRKQYLHLYSLFIFFCKFFSFLRNFYILCPVLKVSDSRREIIKFHNNWSLGIEEPQIGVSVEETLQQLVPCLVLPTSCLFSTRVLWSQTQHMLPCLHRGILGKHFLHSVVLEGLKYLNLAAMSLAKTGIKKGFQLFHSTWESYNLTKH